LSKIHDRAVLKHCFFFNLDMMMFWWIIISLLLLACSNSENIVSDMAWKDFFAEDSLPGMIRVRAVDAVTTLGTGDAMAKVNERPEMDVRFGYDFSIGKHEVTCGEFNRTMEAVTGLSLDCASDSLPAADLSYYDAVLFANERSKFEKMDTAYIYSQASFDSEKHCVNLEGFAYRPETESYRLPTEAEWELVASLGWNLKSAWTADNSGYNPHPVCLKDTVEGRPCDMAGNVMEWVNDWLGAFRDTVVSNYVGALDGGNLGQRVVKGGSFRSAMESIKRYSRGDVYTVTSSTRAEYVGFRLAYGVIPNATWMSSDGKAVESRVVPKANSATLRSLTGTYKVKLVFRNDLTGNLSFIDYSNGILSVNEIGDTLDVYHPEISPDGKKVAFCTGLEGVAGKSALYVRDLNAQGSNLVKLNVESAAVPRWRILPGGDTAIVYVTSAGNNKDEATFKESSTWQVRFAGGKFGSPEKLFDGAFHGGISEDGRLAVTGARLLRARVSGHDTLWYNGEQACNVSLAGDSSRRTLFLDFGGKTGHEFVGEKYGVHERLLIADSSGGLIQFVASPPGYTFDHSEWALGAKNLVVASLTNADGAHSKIILVNVSDSSISELVEGEELWHPCLWVNGDVPRIDGNQLNVDSAGVYFNNLGGEAAIVLRYKMELLWKYKDTANVVVVGSSRPLDGIVPVLMDEKFFALNLSNVPNMMAVSDYLLTNYVVPHVKRLKFVVISLDIDLWYHGETESYNFFDKEYENYPGYVYDRDHNFWKDGFPEYLPQLTEVSMGAEYYQKNFMESRGYNYEAPNTWELNPTVENDSAWMRKKSSNYDASFNRLKKILDLTENYGIYVVGIVFPQSPNFRKTGSWGRYGIRRSEAPALLGQIEELEQQYPHFVFWDENKMGNHDYTDEMASNKDHLSYPGAVQLTARLDSLLKTLK